jgi:hypothetical protein
VVIAQTALEVEVHEIANLGIDLEMVVCTYVVLVQDPVVLDQLDLLV